jgi:hypothetical protein
MAELHVGRGEHRKLEALLRSVLCVAPYRARSYRALMTLRAK